MLLGTPEGRPPKSAKVALRTLSKYEASGLPNDLVLRMRDDGRDCRSRFASGQLDVSLYGFCMGVSHVTERVFCFPVKVRGPSASLISVSLSTAILRALRMATLAVLAIVTVGVLVGKDSTGVGCTGSIGSERILFSWCADARAFFILVSWINEPSLSGFSLADSRPIEFHAETVLGMGSDFVVARATARKTTKRACSIIASTIALDST
mmetsp:Transcript_33988/g.52137  ORF Transcript_33988/g.52137 Transcript_33988/m.52137 type:complete len:209 (-) Transcript_33988:561-1187(-)